MSTMLRSLRERNYLIWFLGSLASNIGTWMQRTAQSWIVLTDLTNHDATALGVVISLQFGPQLVLAPMAGVFADRMSKRKLLIWTQLALGLLALGLGILVTADLAELWHVYAFALGLGIVAALDAPARQAFVSEIVDTDLLSNAIALNSTSFNGARLVGPAVAGVLTVVIGAGPVILVNAATFAVQIVALLMMRRSELLPAPPAGRGRGQIREGIAYVSKRPDIIAVLVAVFLLGTFGFNFPVFLATMATTEFHHNADGFGLLNSILAIGSLSGALMSARRERARMRVLLISCLLFGVAMLVSAAAPDFWTYAIANVAVGFFALTAMTTANALVQGSVEPTMRGRVMSLYMAIFLGGTPLGAPLLGLAVSALGPRATVALGGLSGVIAAVLAFLILRKAGIFAWRDAARMWSPSAPATGIITISDIPDPRTEEQN